jgi:hypothetical protein
MQKANEVQTFYMCDVHGFSAAQTCCNEAVDVGWMEVTEHVQQEEL